MKDQIILEALQKAVTAAVAAPTMPALPVAYIGRTFTVPDDQKYLELVFIPNNRTDDFWGDEMNYQGIFRMILHWRNDDQGAYPPMKVLASVSSYFVKGMLLSGVQISAKPNLTGGPLANGAETLYPASLRYQSYRS